MFYTISTKKAMSENEEISVVAVETASLSPKSVKDTPKKSRKESDLT